MSLKTQLERLALQLGTDHKATQARILNIEENSTGAPPAATETVAGVSRYATTTEAAAGVATDRTVTPAGLKAGLDWLKANLLGGADAAWDTLQELKEFIDNNADFAAGLSTQLGDKANKADVYTKTEIGDPETDLVAAYNTAKA